MVINKCDICHKTIKKDMGLRISRNFFDGFELCLNCAKPMMKFIKDKKLIEKMNKLISK